MEKALTGRVRRESIGEFDPPRLDPAILEAYRRFGDLTGLVSDAMDLLGLSGAVPASILQPTDRSARIVAQAVTILNRLRADSVADVVGRRDNRLGDIEGHNLAQPGDVLVIQGADLVSSMGSISAAIGKRQGEAGAIVDGAVRDVDRSRAIGYPVWSRSVSPVTGKWRLETIGVNVQVTIAGVVVRPGDLVLADEVGVCFVPFEQAAAVVAECTKIAANEDQRQQRIRAGESLRNLARG